MKRLTLAAAVALQIAFGGPGASANQATVDMQVDQYVIGPGDSFLIEHLSVPELSGIFTIGPDGILYLPKLRSLRVDGLSVEALRLFIEEQYTAVLKNPQVYISPVGYRPVTVYVGGEVYRPGFYTLAQSDSEPNSVLKPMSTKLDSEKVSKRSTFGSWPSVFDAIQTANGVTPNADLSKVSVVRELPLGSKHEKAQTTLNLLPALNNGSRKSNIRIYDGDSIIVSKSASITRSQLLTYAKSNLAPRTVNVFVSGSVRVPGPRELPQGATLSQAIASAGGLALLPGKVDYLSFRSNGEVIQRSFSFSANAEAGSTKNPILSEGDIIRVNESTLSTGARILNNVSAPLVGIYSVYSIFK